jgi:hypothetical protein
LSSVGDRGSRGDDARVVFQRLMQTLGAPAGRPPTYYRDMALAFVAVPSGILAALLGFSAVINAAFWISTTVFLLCVAFARMRARDCGGPRQQSLTLRAAA